MTEDPSIKLNIRGRSIPLYYPTGYKPDGKSAPKQSLQLAWVYGYRGKDCRSNIHLLPSGEILYFTAGVVVLHDTDAHKQRHYLEHSDDVKCVDIHGQLVASGQVATHGKTESKPHVRIWDSVTLETKEVLSSKEFERAICCVSFSKKDGNLLAVVDEANDHNLSIWDWSHKKRLATAKSSTDPIFACEFNPTQDGQLVLCGKSAISFWSFDGKSLQKKLGVFESVEKPKFVTCIAFSHGGLLFSGDSNGRICMWNTTSARIIKSTEAIHTGGVLSICPSQTDGILSGGSQKDPKVIEWDSTLGQKRNQKLPENYGGVRVILLIGHKLIIGTTHNCILQLPIGSDNYFKFLAQGHSDEIWGLDVHPSQPELVTCATDKILMRFNADSHEILTRKEIPDAAQCCAYDKRGTAVAIGMRMGQLLILNLTNDEFEEQIQVGKEAIMCVEFAPDNTMLAVGSSDNSIYIYTMAETTHKLTLKWRCTGHSSYITHLDWSSDSHMLRTNSGDYEALMWDVEQKKQVVKPSSVRDTQWSTDRCVLSWSTVGIWGENTDGTDINSCDRSDKSALLATGDDMSMVKIFQFPAAQLKMGFTAANGHSSHVTNVRFVASGDKLISVGGKDASVLQWNVVSS